MTIQEIKELALCSVKGTAPTNYTLNQVDAALVDGLRELGGSINKFMKNRYDIYDIIIETADDVVPDRIIDRLGMFAEIRQIPQGQKAVFTKKLGKTRAKKFITQVGLSGVYETFRLDSSSFTVESKAIGGAGTIDFERMLDGSESMADVIEIITDGLTEAVFVEVQRALMAAAQAQTMPDANKVIESNFDSEKMFALVNTVKSYGGGAVIFAPPEFIAAMGPDAIVPVSKEGHYGGVYHPQDIDAIHNGGYINIFRGTPIVMLPQSYQDDSNTKTVINPQYAYVLPTGGDRVVKVVMEGNTQIYDWTNKDNSMEIDFYKKIGVGILTYNNWGIYQNNTIDDENWSDDFLGL